MTTVTLRDSGRFEWLSQPILSKEAWRGGSVSTTRSSTPCGAGVVDVRLAAFAPRVPRGRREPGGVRRAEYAGIASTKAGDG